MRGLTTALIIALLIAFPILRPQSPVSAQEEERLRVVATFSIAGDIVANVAGDAVELTVIVGADGDAHTFEPSPEQIASLADADLIFANGIGFETWLDDMYEASGSEATRIPLAEGLELLEISGEAHDDHDGEEHDATPDDQDGEAEGEDHDAEDDDHEHEAEGDEQDDGDPDPHVWQDAGNVIAMVAAARDALTAADPANADDYTANAAAYTAQLEALDASIRAMVETVPAENRVLFTSHDALGYFAHAYGFTIAGTALGSVSTEAGDPSAGEIAGLIDQIRASGVPAIFVENVESADLMERIASDAGVTLAPPLYTDALGSAESPAATYLAMMLYNATTIVTALGGQAG